MIPICLDLLAGRVSEWVDSETFPTIYSLLKTELGASEWMMDESPTCDLDCNCFAETARQSVCGRIESLLLLLLFLGLRHFM